MFIKLKHPVDVIDAGPKEKVHKTLQPGVHEVQRIDNPFGWQMPWLVLVGTKIGQSEEAWRKWQSPDWGDKQVVIEE